MKWFVNERGTIPPHRADMTLRGVFLYSKKLTGIFVSTFYVNLGQKLIWSWKKTDIDLLTKHVLKTIIARQKFKLHFKRILEINTKAILAAERVRQNNLKQLSSSELIQRYEDLDKMLLPARGLLDTEVDAFDIGFENVLINALRRATKLNGIQLADLYKRISQPLFQSYLIQQEKEIIRVALQYKVSDRDVVGIYRKFWWTSMGWENIVPHSRAYFTRTIKQYHKLGRRELESRLCSIRRQSGVIRRNRKKLIKQYELGSDVLHLLHVIDRYTLLHDRRKEGQAKSMYAYYLLTKEVARRLKLKIGDLEWLWHREAKNLLCGRGLDTSIIVQRKKAVAALVSKQGIKKWDGQDALAVYKRELKQTKENINQFSGWGVTSGKIRGVARICQGVAEALRKIKTKRDVLVCSMTVPDYMLAIKRAGAIVTNEGGITCHAAIISRELNIPCVVGTKIATKVLQDGDMVEVDANHGWVRKVSE